MTQDLPEQGAAFRDPEWHSELLHPLLFATLATCMIAGPLYFAEAVSLNPRLRAILILCFATALASVYATRWLVLPAQRQTHKTLFRTAEAVVLLLVVRVLSWLISGDLPDLAALRSWILDPLTFFDGFFVVAAILTFLAWDRASHMSTLFYHLGLKEDEIAYVQEQRAGATWRKARPVERVPTSRQDLVEAFAMQWLAGGMVLVFFTGASRLRITRGVGLNLLELGIPPHIILAVVAYFLIGLILVSQARLASMRAQWLFDGVEVPSALPSRWQRLSIAIVLGIGLAATLLPLGSTWRIGEILALIISFFFQIVFVIMTLISWLFTALLSLFSPQEQPEDLATLPQQLEAVEPPQLSPLLTLPPWLGGAAFWLIVGVIVVLAVGYLLRERGIPVSGSGLAQLLGRALARIRQWWLSLRRTVSQIHLPLPTRPATQPDDLAQRRWPWRFIRLGALQPREKVRYFYLSTVRRAADKGVTRQTSQTPREFVKNLEAAWPEAELDVEALTDAFLSARYDAAEISLEEAKEVQSIWQRIKKTLRQGIKADAPRPDTNDRERQESADELS